MTRVRVTAPRSAPRPAGETREAAEESEVGQVFVRSLIRSQLRLALVVAVGFMLILGAFPVLLAAVPGLAETRIAGHPLRLAAAGGRDLPGDRPQRLAVHPERRPE